DDTGCAVACGTPSVESIGARQIRMHHRNPVTETSAEAGEQLRCEGNFRHKYEGLAADGERLGDCLQIHLGLAAARHAFEHERLEASQTSLDRAYGTGL